VSIAVRDRPSRNSIAVSVFAISPSPAAVEVETAAPPSTTIAQVCATAS
jgi:hypothetical protein